MARDRGLLGVLAERRVLRSLGFYLAAAWLVLQATEIFSQIWDLPNWFLQSAFLILALGIPLVAVLSWIYDVKDGDVVRTEGDRLRDLFGTKGPLATAGITLICLILLVTVTFGLLHLWPNENLDPRIKHLMAEGAYSQDSPMLAYSLYGLSAPTGRSPASYGKFITDTYKTLGTIPKNLNPLRFTIDRSDLCMLSRGCDPEQMFTELDSIQLLLKANAELITRYDALHKTPLFSEVVRPTISSPIGEVDEFLLAQFLVKRRIVFEGMQGDPSKAWNQVRSEMVFHRTMLASSNTTLMKMISLISLEEDVRIRILLLAKGVKGNAGPRPAEPVNENETLFC